MQNKFVIGSRKSKLAVIQAEMVRNKLREAGFDSGLKLISSAGDESRNTPSYIIEGTGIFTKAIDDVLLAGEADIGVHSLKDMTPLLHDDLVIGGVLEREDPSDVLVVKDEEHEINPDVQSTIATGSIRRKAQWLNRFPGDKVVPVRGNIDSRLKILYNNPWDGMVLAAAGLLRLKSNLKYRKLEWMIPAPGQGIIAMVANKNNTDLLRILSGISDSNTMLCAAIEKDFLNFLGTGCSVPVGAVARIKGEKIFFQAEILDRTGSRKITMEIEERVKDAKNIVPRAVLYARENGAEELLRQ